MREHSNAQCVLKCWQATASSTTQNKNVKLMKKKQNWKY